VGCILFEILIDKEARAVYTEYDQLSTLRDSQKENTQDFVRLVHSNRFKILLARIFAFSASSHVA
jgi:hypothetical protein